MLDIYEATRLIDRIKQNDELNIDAVMIFNSVNKNYGKTYVRTRLDFVSNIGLFPEHGYISYRIDYRGEEDIQGLEDKITATQKECDAVLQEQLKDIETFKQKLFTEFPEAEVCVLMCPYLAYGVNDCLITGEVVHSDCQQPITNPELEREHANTLKYFDYWKAVYSRVKKWSEERIQKINGIIREEIQKFH